MRLSGDELARRFKTAKILIAEDDEFIRVMLSSILSANGINNLIFATDGYTALRKLESEEPDLVILGIMLKVIDGLDLCAQVRLNPKFNDLPILVQTALTNAEERLAAFEVGATDLVNKPINPREFIARIKLHLENRFLMRDMEQYRHGMLAELNQARQMQDMILPKNINIDHLEKKYGLKISAYFETCDIMGGDFWGTKPISDSLMGFYIIDCTGHGISAALNTFRIHAIMNDIDEVEHDLDAARYLTRLNKKLCELFSPGQFATMFYGIIDIENDKISYSAAATTSPAILSKDGELKLLSGEGYQLGVKKKAHFTIEEVPFKRGDKIILYSDALIENIGIDGQMYGEQRLVEAVKSNTDAKDGGALLARIMHDFNRHRKNKLTDDLTINIYTRL